MPGKTTNSDDNLITSMSKNAAASAITGLLGYLISLQLKLPDDLKTVIVAIAVLIGSLIYTSVITKVRNFPKDMGKRYMEEQTGIIEVFPSLEACIMDMKAEFEKAKQIRLLLQIGRKELGDSEASIFSQAAQKKNKHGEKIRVLRGSKDSPFLSEERAQSRGNSIRRWREDIRRLANEIDLLREIHEVSIEDREHFEPYLWRIFLFDDVAYVSAYLHQSDNDRRAVVYKLIKKDTSLFAIFDKYFEYLWAKSDPADSEKSIAEWAKQI